MENIRPINSEAEYERAIAEIARYFDREPVAGSLEAGRFDMLAIVIEAYETKNYPIEAK